MAWLWANNQQIDLSNGINGQWQDPLANDWKYILSHNNGAFGKNININFLDPSNPIYADDVEYKWSIDNTTYSTHFSGQGLNYDFMSNPNAPSGNVTLFQSLSLTNGVFTPGLAYGGFDIPLSTLHYLVSSPTQSDHMKWAAIVLSKNDSINGGAKDDVLQGYGGNDTTNGYGGFDTVFYADANNVSGYKRSDFQVTKNADAITVNDSVANRFGTDTLISIEKIQFSDGSLFYDAANNTENALVYRLYKAAFARTPDDGGFHYWADQKAKGLDFNSIASSFRTSDEFKQKYGDLSNNDYVTKLYSNVLGRTPDAGGLAWWQNELNSGHQTRDQLLIGFAGSQENVNGTAANIDNGFWLV